MRSLKYLLSACLIKANYFRQIMIFLDWYTEKVARWVVELRSRVEDWKRILEMAIEREFSYGVRGEGLKFISGHGS